MKRNEVFLDFTPLLDVTLILLFFFLLFSTFEVEEAKAKLDVQVEAAQAQLSDAENRMDQANALFDEANSLNSQLQEDLAILESANGRQASNIEALMVFNRGTNIKLILSMADGEGIIKIFQGDTLLTKASPHSDIASILCDALNESGYEKDDTILCEFILNGSEPGTASAYRKIKDNLQYVKGTYHYFYYSETDTSIGDE